ncbi:ferredoxin--NADP reductase [Haloarcula nitratireducens]|uniref:Oxidoreductase n=1 Tax=Haloarcula nitratireducens TaxID=2487749 RepID=A0AAW4P821_9EURY|nr:FAD-binding oxidoreductase [Halomicroarcula nitratireducens]MBX0293989.1 oxidoreductase [Halomicroarcula nitratireducens]
MDVREHLSQHERVEQLPLVTESATVTLAEAMDDNRTEAVEDAIRGQLEPLDGANWLDEIHDGAEYQWEELSERLDAIDVSEHRRDDISTLVDRLERAYPSLLQVRVRAEEELDFAPGQYVTLQFHDTPRAYSLADSPNEDELAFGVRRVPGGRLTSDLFQELEVGDQVVVRGPNGEMTLDEPSNRDMVFLATGTGAAPFKSMIDYTFEEGRDTVDGEQRDVWLFLGCGWEDDIPHREHFRELADERENFHFVPTLTRESLLTDWDGETDYVQQVFIKYLDDELDETDLPDAFADVATERPKTDVDARIRPENTELYACGVTAMVTTLVRAAKAVGVPEDSMQYEGFG